MYVLGHHVEHLSLRNSSILENTFISILEHCENLKSLDLSGCNSLFMSGSAFLSRLTDRSIVKSILAQITSLELSSSRYINDAILCRFFKLCPSLTSLSLASNNLLCK
uniref:F-box/LRR-repeat protein 7-like n=1 Tax=Phallusia mammillata TaxID=59560 RepID=A0A6F9DDA9_9ASCI|nr:F-box/LRR-repeat protein 7-like [Phallusia mammillata]